ncbi:MAG: hypothetical protein ACT4PP_05405 [Sporichthyaceae bacterium]
MGALASTAIGRRLCAALIIATAVVLSAFLTVYSLNRLGVDLAGIKGAVDIGGENNIPTWWNGLLLLSVAVTAIAAARRAAEPAQRHAWWVIAAAGGYLTLDELAQLHERLNEPVRSTGISLPTYAWLLPGVVLAGAGAVILVRAGRHLPVFTARRLGLALGVFACGALGMEALNGLVSGRWLDLELLFAAGTTIEESLEMLACVLAVTAIVDHLVGSTAPARDPEPASTRTGLRGRPAILLPSPQRLPVQQGIRVLGGRRRGGLTRLP